mgnify:CR=1 FL=1
MLSEESGILSVERYLSVLLSLFKNQGGFVLFNTEFAGVRDSGKTIKLLLSNDSGESEVTSRYVINAAGLSAASVSTQAGFQNIPDVYFCMGHYFRVLGARNQFNHLIYPVPNETYLGTHITIDLNGEVKLGPDAVYMDDNIEDYRTFISEKKTFVQDVTQFWPGIKKYTLVEDFIGIRPKLYSSGMDSKDFYIRDELRDNTARWISLYGIESPGVTASMALGPYIHREYFN